MYNLFSSTGFFTRGFGDGFTTLGVTIFAFHSAFLAVPISRTGEGFVLFRRGVPFLGLLGIFGSVLLFPDFSNIALIMLFGSFLDFMNLPTAFDAIPLPISDTPHRTSPISILPPQLTIFPAPSIAPIESTNPPIFWRLNTISRATVSPYTFLSAQYAFLISLNCPGIVAIESSSPFRISSTRVIRPRLYASLFGTVVSFNTEFSH